MSRSVEMVGSQPNVGRNTARALQSSLLAKKVSNRYTNARKGTGSAIHVRGVDAGRRSGHSSRVAIDLDTKGHVDKPNILALGELFRVTRESLHLSQKQASALAGVSKGYLSQVESGKIKDMAFAKVVRLCDLYGLDIRQAVAAERRSW